MKQFEIPITKTARFFVLGTPGKKIKRIWIVCHGYGQLAGYFLRKFNLLDDGTNLIASPEGFHRFYVKGYSGRVGAGWMTKEDRQRDIRDYVAYLDDVYRIVTGKFNENQPEVVVLGFSQGTHTVCRWLCQGNVRISRLILWGGTVPDDLSDKGISLLNSLNPQIWMGDEDEFISADHLEERQQKMKQNQVNYQLKMYKGGHDIMPEILAQLYEELR